MTHRFCRVLITLIVYGFWPILVLGLFTFIYGTGDFSQWGQQGRINAVAAGFVGLFFYSMVVECSNIRRELVEILMEMDHEIQNRR